MTMITNESEKDALYAEEDALQAELERQRDPKLAESEDDSPVPPDEPVKIDPEVERQAFANLLVLFTAADEDDADTEVEALPLDDFFSHTHETTDASEPATVDEDLS